jgi:hypothetical protein
MPFALREKKLVFAARVKHSEDHQIRIREKPLFRLCFGGFRCASQRSEMAIAGETAQVFQADARQARDFILGKELLARFDSDHSCSSQGVRCSNEFKRCNISPAIVVPYYVNRNFRVIERVSGRTFCAFCAGQAADGTAYSGAFARSKVEIARWVGCFYDFSNGVLAAQNFSKRRKR